MAEGFGIEAKWVDIPIRGDAEQATAAYLRISFGADVATWGYDEWSGSTRDDALLSAYPLALWLASSWWRLRWEPGSLGSPNHSWKTAHHLAAAGHGFVWPKLSFQFDGERIEVVCSASSPAKTESFHYLKDFQTSISPDDFESEVIQFIENVINRLDCVNIVESDLHSLWDNVKAERANKTEANYRRLEAQLGFEPDEAPDPVINRLTTLELRVGRDAVAEVAPACGGPEAASLIGGIDEMVHSSLGITGVIESRKLLVAGATNLEGVSAVPWKRGWKLAHNVRNIIDIGGGKVPSAVLAEMLNISENDLLNGEKPAYGKPLSLTVRDDAQNAMRYFFRRANPLGRRFEAARFLVDSLVAQASDRWLPVTDTQTIRQKVQRAFAAEFLCPVNAVNKFLNGDFSDGALQSAGDHFEVSRWAITSNLVNHGILPPERC